MIKLLIAVVVILAGAYTAGDLYVRNYTDHQLTERIAAVVPEAQHPSVKISSFPFVAPLLLSGDVRRVSAQAGPVTEGRVTFSRISVFLRDVKLNRTELLRNRRGRRTPAALPPGRSSWPLADVRSIIDPRLPAGLLPVPRRIGASGLRLQVFTRQQRRTDSIRKKIGW